MKDMLTRHISNSEAIKVTQENMGTEKLRENSTLMDQWCRSGGSKTRSKVKKTN